jgi:hypothetical protein
MNKDMLKKNLHDIVRLRPMAKSCNSDQYGQCQMQDKDDDWVIDSINDNGITIINTRNRKIADLGFDHIYKHMGDPENSKRDTREHGFLLLNVQIYYSSVKLWIEPIRK